MSNQAWPDPICPACRYQNQTVQTQQSEQSLRIAIPVFGSQDQVPRTVAGLLLDGIQRYDDSSLGVSFRYTGSRFRVDAYLYDMGGPAVEADVQSSNLLARFEIEKEALLLGADAVHGVDVKLIRSGPLYVPDGAPAPICLWAVFGYIPQSPAPEDSPGASILALRSDCGMFNKLRCTFPAITGAEFDDGLELFIQFLLAWTTCLQSFTSAATSSGTFPCAPRAAAKNSVPVSSVLSDEAALQRAIDELESLVGLGRVKDEVKRLMSFLTIQRARREQGLRESNQSRHFVFTGNPGTGKTTVARVLSSILYGYGILKTAKLVECDRSKLVGAFLGQTAIQTDAIIESALDGVLFIDEAYSLSCDPAKFGVGDMYGEEAINILLKRMEDYRDRLVVIAAGYPRPMQRFLEANPGIQSRFTRFITFDDYSVPELCHILNKYCEESQYFLTSRARAKAFLLFTLAHAQRNDRFGNARFVRNVFEEAVVRHSARIVGNITRLSKSALMTLDETDIPLGSYEGRLAAVKICDSRWRGNCPACGKLLRAELKHIGRTVRCKCGHSFAFPWWDPVIDTVPGFPS